MSNILFQAYDSHLINPLSTKINQYVDSEKILMFGPGTQNKFQIPQAFQKTYDDQG